LDVVMSDFFYLAIPGNFLASKQKSLMSWFQAISGALKTGSSNGLPIILQ
jgi:hypothetical protein